ncbi:DUF5011 domain-containing protein [Microbulbifer sp. YPW16]|uniref:DUF5011 domain-containing protein n=1 Tax=unclassified Microbulbifer TaxID=2619833 RepID=UPI001E33E6F6|nr:DUF5011 domain-containing protein [Microbulbifer sp. YPW16]UHQ56648.1 DUF5011 domain-containing protein [Microbulbifer sp. YPW16]
MPRISQAIAIAGILILLTGVLKMQSPPESVDPSDMPLVAGQGQGNGNGPKKDPCECDDGGGGSANIDAILRVLTRSSGVSPETIYFSAQDSTDTACQDLSGGTDPVACATGQWFAYHFNFDDPESGEFSTTMRSRNQQVGSSPRAIHTFVCTPSSSRYVDGACEYNVGVRVQNPSGDYEDAFTTVRVLAQEAYYTPDSTICVSPAGDYNGCPAGAVQASDLPATGEYAGKRVLLHAGESFGRICTDYGEGNITIDRYGEGARPVVEDVRIGVAGRCEDRSPTSAQAQGYPELVQDNQGNIVQGWSYNVTVTGIRAGNISGGMAATLVTVHNVDMDWSETGQYWGTFSFTSQANYCGKNPDILDCSLLHWPYGIFLSDSVLKSHPDNLPNVNIGCMDSCQMVNGGLIGNDVTTAMEHNARFMGVWGLVVSNVWHRGNHIGGRGGKHRLALRGSGGFENLNTTKNPEDLSGTDYLRTGDISNHWAPRFNFVVDSFFNDTVLMPEHDSAAFVELSSGYLYSGMFNSRFFPDTVDNLAAQVRVGGVDVVLRGNQYHDSNPACRQDNGELHDENQIFTDAEGCTPVSSGTAPMPDVPGR